MSPDTEEFHKLSKKEWLEKLQQNLKGQDPLSITTALDPEIELNPFVHPSDQEEFRPLSQTTHGNKWVIGEAITLRSSAAYSNQSILEALKSGANALVLDLPKDFTDLESLFNSVNISMIDLYLTLESPGYIKNNSFFNDHKNDLSAYVRFRNNSQDLFQGINLEGYQNLKLRSVIADENLYTVSQLTKILTRLYQLLTVKGGEHNTREIIKSIFIELPLGRSYFLEIARLRAVRILWANLLTAIGEDPGSDLHILARPKTEALKSDDNTNFILLTTIFMSAIIGGADFVFTNHIENADNQEFTSRITRNIQNILLMESFFDLVHDPAAGSIYIEKLTRIIVERTWQNFLKEIKQD